jgi:hypothetical protein
MEQIVKPEEYKIIYGWMDANIKWLAENEPLVSRVMANVLAYVRKHQLTGEELEGHPECLVLSLFGMTALDMVNRAVPMGAAHQEFRKGQLNQTMNAKEQVANLFRQIKDEL